MIFGDVKNNTAHIAIAFDMHLRTPETYQQSNGHTPDIPRTKFDDEGPECGRDLIIALQDAHPITAMSRIKTTYSSRDHSGRRHSRNNRWPWAYHSDSHPLPSRPFALPFPGMSLQMRVVPLQAMVPLLGTLN